MSLSGGSISAATFAEEKIKNSVTILYNKCINITIPSATEYFYKLGVENLVLSTIAMVLTTMMMILYAIEMYYVFKYVSPYTNRAGKLIWMAGVQPLTAVGCLIAICVPRSLAIIEMFILLYFARCLFSITQLVVDFFGNRMDMARALQGTTIRLNTLPVCCCCVFFPRVQPSAKVIRRIEWLVYQTAIIRPLLFVITGTINADLAGYVPMERSITTATNVINIVSTLTAMYGFLLIANMTDKPLKPYCTKALMKLTQLTIVLYNIQGGILNLLAQQGVISCSQILPAISRAAEWHFFLLIIESFLIAMGAAFFLRPKVNATFDLYPVHLANPISKNPKNWRYDQADADGDLPSKFAIADFPEEDLSDPEMVAPVLPMGAVPNGSLPAGKQRPRKPKPADPLSRYPKTEKRDKLTSASKNRDVPKDSNIGITV